MPIVDLHVAPNLGNLNVSDIQKIRNKLKFIVAKNLSPSETGDEVKPEEVEIFSHLDSLELLEDTTYGIRLIITAFEFPSRVQNISHRLSQLTQEARLIVPPMIKIWVHINLVKGARASNP